VSCICGPAWTNGRTASPQCYEEEKEGDAAGEENRVSDEVSIFKKEEMMKKGWTTV
jgi:hypothetical protein